MPPAAAIASSASRARLPAAASFRASIRPASTQAPGSTFAVNVLLRGAQNVYSVPLQVSYDPKILQVVNVSNGGLLSQDGQAVALVHRDDDTTGHAADYRHPASGSGAESQDRDRW